MRHILLAFLLFGFTLPCAGQSVNASLPAKPPSDTQLPNLAELQSLLDAKKPPFTFSVDDVLTAKVYGIDTYADSQRVTGDGTVVFPLIGKTQVAGLTINQLEASIAQALEAKGMVRDPQVTITAELRPSEVVSVLGNVNHPGTYPAAGNLTLADYVSEASGFIESSGGTPNSPGSYTVTLFRPSLGTPVRIPLGPEPGNAHWGMIPIFAGDQIRVDKVGTVYAIGAFRVQGGFPLKNASRTSVIQLVALAGGMGYEAAAGSSHIVRKENGQQTLIDINVAKILKGTAPDVVLQPDDILFVPTNQLKAAIKGGGPGLVLSAITAAVYTR